MHGQQNINTTISVWTHMQ